MTAEPGAAIVLAGGNSTRYGDRNKLLERLGDAPVVEHVIGSFAPAVDSRPIVVVRTAAQRQAIEKALADPDAVRFRFDDPDFDGPLAGIAGAVTETDATWGVVCGGDMPLVSPAAVERLAAHREDRADAVLPVREGTPEPLFGLYRLPALADALAELPADAGPRALRSLLAWTPVPVSDSAEGPLARALVNVNTPEEFNRVARGLRRRGDGLVPEQ